MSGPSFLLSVLYAAGLLLVFVGERLLVGTGRAPVSGLGAFLVLLSVALRAARARRAEGERRRVEGSLLGLTLLGALALGAYALQADLASPLWGRALEQSSPRLAGVLACLYPLLLLLSLLPMVGVELAYASMARAPRLELGRIRDARLSGMGLAAALVFGFSAYYVADARDVKADLSYFRTARPGTASRRIVRALTEPLKVSLFFPPHNDVGQAVREYFGDLAAESPKVEVQSLDQVMDPAKAKELGVTGNGAVVLQRGTRKEPFLIGLDMERARQDLRTLDREIQKRILEVTRSRRTLYFTVGHGERGETQLTPLDQRPTLKQFRDLLRAENAEVKELGAAGGLAVEVPRDAAAVLILGPTTALLPEELASLNRYAERGGRMLIALDPEAGLSFSGLVAPWGVTFVPTTLCNDHVYVQRTHELSDRALLATQSFSSHPAVTTLSQLGSRVGVVLLGAGYLEPQSKPLPGVSVDFSLRALPDTWNDVNGNFEFDPKTAETRKAYALMAAVTRREGKEEARAVVLSDADLVTDVVFQNPGNTYLAADAVKWLTGEESTAGTFETEVDAPLEHTRGQDVLWFYSTVFLVPAAVLVAGYVVSRRRRRAAR